MSESPLGLGEFAAAFRRHWNAFFLGPQDLRVCGLVRIAFGALLMVHYLALGPRLELWFGETGLMPRDVAWQLCDPYSYSILFWVPPTTFALQVCYALAISQAFLLMVGLWPRLQAFCSLIWLVSFQARNPIIWDSEDTLMRLICFYLLLMPLERIWAIGFPWRVARSSTPEKDALLNGPHGPAWGLRLLQLQIALVFWVAGVSKLYGRSWIDGDAVYYVARLHEFFPRFPVPNYLFDTPWTVKLMTWSVIVVELGVPILVWFKETRRAALLLALAFHFASDYSMNLFLFHWLMLTGWMAFLTTSDLDLWRGKRSLPI